MAKNPDAYLLYEYMDKVCYTVRAKIRLSETIDEKLLNCIPAYKQGQGTL